ncbi:amidase family protein [Streptomyces sp. AJS327]|uniref:amidase family protein n=1 Tax=Streptomyces sp. AJS327 TaxID=2545265 RepID=UPI0027E414DB|nr:amidase family protein [Streptomyces sp. AJS327]
MEGELWTWEATALAAAVRTGELSAREVVDSHLERIAAVNPQVNALAQLQGDRARESAAALDRARSAGHDPGPLAGVPFSVKASLDIEGVPTTHGARHFARDPARRDAPPVARLRSAGAIPLAHGNMPTLTLAGVHSRSQLFGDTANPWNAQVTPGGSSGGDGAAVASGMVPFGLGQDAGGSVRLPAAFCGVAGLKPSSGRYPADHRIGPEDPPLGSQELVVDGPLARSTGDLRAIHRVLSGTDPRDPRALPVPVNLPEVDGPIRVAVVTDPGWGVHPDVRAAVEAAAGALSDAGYPLVEVPGPPMLEETLEAYGQLVMTEFSGSWPRIRTCLDEEEHRYIEFGMARTAPVGLAEYLRLTGTRLSVRRAWAEFQREYPLMLGPVSTEPAFPPGLEARDAEGHRRVTQAISLCSVTSFAGLPSAAVSGGVFGGLPQGVQLIGRVFREDLCLDAAAAVEARIGRLAPVGRGA